MASSEQSLEAELPQYDLHPSTVGRLVVNLLILLSLEKLCSSQRLLEIQVLHA